MSIIAALILTVLCFLVIAAPFFRRGQRDSWAAVAGTTPDTSDTADTMRKQLDIDYQSGILSAEDYRSQRPVYTEGAASLTQGAAETASGGIDAAIEMKVARLRRGQMSDLSDEIEDQVRRLRQQPPGPTAPAAEKSGSAQQSKGRFCPQCGGKRQPGDRFCVRCGEKLA